MHSSCVFKEE